MKVKPDDIASSPVDLDGLFASEVGSQNDVIKELFSSKDPKARTDLNAEQISAIARAYFLASMLRSERLSALLNEFVVLRISKDRKSRAEFVESAKGMDVAGKAAMGLGQLAAGGLRR